MLNNIRNPRLLGRRLAQLYKLAAFATLAQIASTYQYQLFGYANLRYSADHTLNVVLSGR